MFVEIVGEVLATFTVLVIGSLHFANKIHKRWTETECPAPTPPVQPRIDPRVAALLYERGIVEKLCSYNSGANIVERQQAQTRLKEITQELGKIP